jgi:serine/threonine protein kinase/tetratricopeptide (TPR) repeat protein
MQLSAGARVRSFEVLGPLGAGGMGTLYRARDGKLGRDVAIKFVQDKLSGSREYLQRFKREARAASALCHPNIITIFEIDEFEGAPFIAMELIDGHSLRELLGWGPFGTRKLLDVAAQIAEGLAAAHERGIVHRDLKPENVMVTRDGRVKIVDFGLARMVHVPAESASADSNSTGDITSTLPGRVLGTPSYVSPEQAAGGRTVDFRSDQFSFASILYELATGKRAFMRKTVVETLAAIMRDEPEPVQRLSPSIPPPLSWIIERCLAKDPADRYASTRDLARELRTLRERLPETSPGLIRLRRLIPRTRLLAASAVALALLATASTVVYSEFQYDRPPVAVSKRITLAVLPFTDLSGRPDSQLFSRGFSETVRARLAAYEGLQVVDLSSLPRAATPIDQSGATLQLRASVQRSGDELRVAYSIRDAARGTEIAGNTINGTLQNIWSFQDEVVDAIVRDLGIEQRPPPTRHAGLDTAEEQDLYVRALGALDHPDKIQSVDTAIPLLHQVLETAPDSPLVHAALGRAYYQKYNLTYDKQWSDKAIRACKRARALDPDTPDTLITLATVESLIGNYNAAIAAYRRALALRPTSAVAALGLATTHRVSKQYQEAEHLYKRGIALQPTWWYGYNELGTLYFGEGRYDEALTQYREVIRRNPRGAWGYTNSGAVLITKGKLEAAVEMLTKATSVDKASATPYSNLGYCYFFLGQYDRAVEYGRKATAIRPNVSTYWIELGDACALSSAWKKDAMPAYATATERARQELAVNPKHPRANAAMALSLAKTGHFAEARRHMARALELAPEDPDYLYRAARVASLAGDLDDALAFFNRAWSAGSTRLELERHPDLAAVRNTTAARQLMASRKDS